MNKNDVNKIYNAACELIAAAKAENPRTMKHLFRNVPVNDSENVAITAEYEITDDGDVGCLWIDFEYSRGEFYAWIHRTSNEIRNAAEEIFQISKEE